VVAHQYPLSASTLSNRKHPVSLKTAPYIPALKDGVLRRTGKKARSNNSAGLSGL